MADTVGLYRTKLANGMEVAYIDKGVKNPLGMPKEAYEEKGYKPAWKDLPEK